MSCSIDNFLETTDYLLDNLHKNFEYVLFDRELSTKQMNTFSIIFFKILDSYSFIENLSENKLVHCLLSSSKF